jgi:hypothetical protein
MDTDSGVPLEMADSPKLLDHYNPRKEHISSPKAQDIFLLIKEDYQ